ncbi:MAG: GNAT family N-acetyltransferase [Candidatus Omnitrophica bacterium]|nr:GNAT family N-acetyltransferase [Candidatus Omnitrophota bacterium]MCB9719948.1 GNAT family N-acetyltransferase [Candidatus Omnitrophota bacterium]
MSPSFNIIPKDQLTTILPLLKKLDPAIGEDVLEERLAGMMDLNYQCVGVYQNDQLIGMSGFWLLNKYYVGKHLEPDNVFILEEYRSGGLGHLLIEWLENYARKAGCRAIELNCYLKNTEGNRFWEKEGYRPLGIHYQKILE